LENGTLYRVAVTGWRGSTRRRPRAGITTLLLVSLAFPFTTTTAITRTGAIAGLVSDDDLSSTTSTTSTTRATGTASATLATLPALATGTTRARLTTGPAFTT